jgi:hypothetical protein
MKKSGKKRKKAKTKTGTYLLVSHLSSPMVAVPSMATHLVQEMVLPLHVGDMS